MRIRFLVTLFLIFYYYSSSIFVNAQFGRPEEEMTRVSSLQLFLARNIASDPGIQLSPSTQLYPSYYAAEILDTLQLESKIINQSVFSPSDYVYTISNLLSKFQDTETGGFTSSISTPPPPPPSPTTTSNPATDPTQPITTPTPTTTPTPSSINETDRLVSLSNTYSAVRIASISDSKSLRHPNSDSIHKKISIPSILKFLHSSLSPSSTPEKMMYSLFPNSKYISSSSIFQGYSIFSSLSSSLSSSSSSEILTNYPSPRNDEFYETIMSLFISFQYESDSGKKREVSAFLPSLLSEKDKGKERDRLTLKSTYECLYILKGLGMLEKFFSDDKSRKDAIKTFVFAHRDDRTGAFCSQSPKISSSPITGVGNGCVADLLSSQYSLQILELVDFLENYLKISNNKQKLLDFVLNLQRNDGGFSLHERVQLTTYEATLAAVKSLALSSQLKYLYQRIPTPVNKSQTSTIPKFVIYLWALLVIAIVAVLLYLLPSDKKKKVDQDAEEEDDDEEDEDEYDYDEEDENEEEEDENEGSKARRRSGKIERVITLIQETKTGNVFDLDGKNVSTEGIITHNNNSNVEWEILEKHELQDGALIKYTLKKRDLQQIHHHTHQIKKSGGSRRTKKGR